jgi:threonine-phosphate decarboxylase
LLRCAISESTRVSPDWLYCGNGAADVIHRLCLAIKPGKALVLAPTFAEYEAALTTVGCNISRHTLVEGNGFAVTESILSSIQGMDAVFLCNPNNPTGLLAEPALLRSVASRCARGGAALIVDESFIDFTDKPYCNTLLPELAAYPNIVIIRSFTKMYAMPGLRLGYCVSSNTSLIERLYAPGPPWAVSAMAMAAGVAALKEAAFVSRTRELIASERTRLIESLRALGLHAYGGAANFLLARCDTGIDIPAALAGRGVYIRKHIGFHMLDERYFRVAVRMPDDNDRLISALRGILNKED